MQLDNHAAAGVVQDSSEKLQASAKASPPPPVPQQQQQQQVDPALITAQQKLELWKYEQQQGSGFTSTFEQLMHDACTLSATKCTSAAYRQDGSLSSYLTFWADAARAASCCDPLMVEVLAACAHAAVAGNVSVTGLTQMLTICAQAALSKPTSSSSTAEDDRLLIAMSQWSETAKPHGKRSRDSINTECCVCMAASRCMLFMPCKHLCTCEDCGKLDKSNSNTLRYCPICTKVIKTRMRIFM